MYGHGQCTVNKMKAMTLKQVACEGLAGCTGFVHTWSPTGSHGCSMKNFNGDYAAAVYNDPGIVVHNMLRWVVKENKNLGDHDLSTGTGSVESCKAECGVKPRCTGFVFSWSPTGSHSCQYKNFDGDYLTTVSNDPGVMVYHIHHWVQHTNKQLSGSDIGTRTGRTVEECKVQCEGLSGCTGFVFNWSGSGTHTCYMKNYSGKYATAVSNDPGIMVYNILRKLHIS